MIRSPLAALLAVLIVAPGARAIEATGYDAVTTPGRAVSVGGKFERHGVWIFRPDITRARSTISVLGQRLSARTDGDGVAHATVTPSTVGVFPVEVTLDGKSAPAARGRLWVLDPTRPVAVVDIDGTLSDMPDWLVPFAGHKAKTFPGAPDTLRALATSHQIVYLTARDDTFDGKSRAFLARHGFPDGPVIYDDLGLRTKAEREQLKASNHGRFKLGVLQGLRARGVRLALGLGNAETDAFAYESAGLPSYIRTTKTGTGPSFRFQDDATQLRPRLVADGFLPRGLVSALTP